MTGLLLLGVAGLWLLLAIAISSRIARLAPERWRGLVKVLSVIALAALPLADEIVGGFQFRSLCEQNASRYRLGVEKPEGRTTKVTFNPSNRDLDGTAIPIRHSRIEYYDTTTGELVVALDEYVAKGGLFIRALGISQNNSPLTIGRPGCSPRQGKSPHLTFKFDVIN